MILQEYIDDVDNFQLGETISMFEKTYMLHTKAEGVSDKWLDIVSYGIATPEKVIDTWERLWDDSGDLTPKIVKLGSKEVIVFKHQLRRRILRKDENA